MVEEPFKRNDKKMVTSFAMVIPQELKIRVEYNSRVPYRR